MGARPARPPASDVVVDTDVVIWYLRGSEDARDFLDSIRPSQRVLSPIVKMELLRGSRDRAELRSILRLCDTAFGHLAHISEEISRRATALTERHALAHRPSPEDALIAATALTLGAVLATGNVRHYSFVKGLDILPFEE